MFMYKDMHSMGKTISAAWGVMKNMHCKFCTLEVSIWRSGKICENKFAGLATCLTGPPQSILKELNWIRIRKSRLWITGDKIQFNLYAIEAMMFINTSAASIYWKLLSRHCFIFLTHICSKVVTVWGIRLQLLLKYNCEWRSRYKIQMSSSPTFVL